MIRSIISSNGIIVLYSSLLFIPMVEVIIILYCFGDLFTFHNHNNQQPTKRYLLVLDLETRLLVRYVLLDGFKCVRFHTIILVKIFSIKTVKNAFSLIVIGPINSYLENY